MPGSWISTCYGCTDTSGYVQGQQAHTKNKEALEESILDRNLSGNKFHVILIVLDSLAKYKKTIKNNIWRQS